MVFYSSRQKLLSVFFFVILPAPVLSEEMRVEIRADFPGGNVKVVKNNDKVVEVAPDLRGGPSWFYWYFAAKTSQPGTVAFVFANPPMIGVRGPAVSYDEGKSWAWLGAEHVVYAPPARGDKSALRQDRFTFTFTRAQQSVRFAVTIPYVQTDLDRFLAWHTSKPYLTRSTLAETRVRHRKVDLLQIGESGPGVQAILLTARHHACESMASYVLEGILEEAMASSSTGIAFRRNYILYAVPLVDMDGVEAGDQGKNRLPKDYNRDYGADAIYPEIRAIQELADLRKVQFSLDLHCPYLVGEIHEAFHFLGLGVPHIKDNLNELCAWLDEERPRVAMTPLKLLIDPNKPQAENPRINSHYFARRKGALLAATLEIPYAQRNTPSDPAMARAYGASILKAWVRTKFVSSAGSPRETEGHADYAALRRKFQQICRSNPLEAETLARVYLNGKEAPAVYRAEASFLMAILRLQRKRYTDALQYCEAVLRDDNATALQQSSARLLGLQAVCGSPKSAASDVDVYLGDALCFPYLSPDQKGEMFEAVSEYYFNRKEYDKSLSHVWQQLTFAARYDEGRQWNRIAALQELLGKPEEAIASRKEAVKVLTPQLRPVPPRSIFGAMMTHDLFEALCGIPTSTLEEKRAAAALVLNHEIAPAALKEKVRRALADLEKNRK